VNAVTKSGTNQIHGDLFENLRNPIFNALDPAIKTAAAAGTTPTKSVHQQNQFGGSVGGPVMKDKLFYFITYDGYRKVTPIAYTSSTPNIPGLTCPTQITAAQCAAAVNYILTQNLGTFPRELVQDVAFDKIDYQLSANHHLNVAFNWRNWFEPNGTAFASSNNSGLTTATDSFIQDRFLIATWNAVIGGNKVNQLLYQFGQDHSYTTRPASHNPPAVSISQIFSYGSDQSAPNFNREDRNQISDSFSFGSGRHAFKTGVDVSFIHTSLRTGTNSAYSYSGAVALPAGTCVAPLPSLQTTNTIFCDWLVDLYGVNTGASTGQHWITYAAVKDQRFPGNALGQLYPAGGDDTHSDTVGAFFQDTWKLRSNLTLNLGLRYDIQFLPQQSGPNTNTPLLAYYTSTIHTDNTGIAPRLGIAWNFTKKSVLRAGFGTFVANTSISTITAVRRTTGLREQSFNCQAGATTGVCAGLTFPNVLWDQILVSPAAPFNSASLTASQQPLTPIVVNPAGDGCVNNPSCAIRGIVPDFVSPRAYQGEVAFERQLPGNISFSASYILTRGVHLPVYYDTNIAPTTLTKSYDVLAGSTGTPATTLTSTVPFFTTRLNPATGPVTGPILAAFSVANSWYNGVVLSIRKPMSHGVEVLANYTLSQGTDDGEASSNTSLGSPGLVVFSGPGVPNPYNLKTEQGASGNDNRHRFTGSVVWQPALGKNLSNRFERGLVDGWNLSGTLTATTGTPYSGLISSTGVQCLVIVTPCPVGSMGLDGGMTSAILSTSGNSSGGRIVWVPRNSFYLPSYANVDLRLAKEFTIHERFSFELRGELFNLINSTIVQGVNQSAYNYVAAGSGTCATHANTCLAPLSTFQQSQTTSSNLLGSRQAQFGARFNF